jgi:hypothetical protein
MKLPIEKSRTKGALNKKGKKIILKNFANDALKYMKNLISKNGYGEKEALSITAKKYNINSNNLFSQYYDDYYKQEKKKNSKTPNNPYYNEKSVITMPLEKCQDSDKEQNLKTVIYVLNGNEFTKYLNEEEVEEIKVKGAKILEIR